MDKELEEKRREFFKGLDLFCLEENIDAPDLYHMLKEFDLKYDSQNNRLIFELPYDWFLEHVQGWEYFLIEGIRKSKIGIEMFWYDDMSYRLTKEEKVKVQFIISI